MSSIIETLFMLSYFNNSIKIWVNQVKWVNRNLTINKLTSFFEDRKSLIPGKEGFVTN